MNDDDPIPILCVDGDPALLAGMARQLRHLFALSTAMNGADALELIRLAPAPYVVIVSEMVMPGMNGVEFLRQARAVSPRSKRVILTGHSAIDIAAAAVNDGAISRLLTKPCGPDQLIGALNECVDEYRLANVEQDLLERTLRACVEAFAQTIALAAPSTFGRVTRVHRTVQQLVAFLQPEDGWAIELAVPLSQLGAVSTRPELLEKINDGLFLEPSERAEVDQIPRRSLALIDGIAPLDRVCNVIRETFMGDVRSPDRSIGAKILWVALELDVAEMRGLTRDQAVRMLSSRVHVSDLAILDAILKLDDGPTYQIAIDRLRSGMVLARDVVDRNGVLLVGRGSRVTGALRSHLDTFVAVRRIHGEVWVRDA